jgi:ribonuclease HI
MTEYYTDGSASPNPGAGGYAVIKNGQPYLIGGEPSGGETTNIRMEGLAIKAALEDAAGEPCEIKTDSEFWVNVLTEWAPAWAANDWQKKGGIKNPDIVRALHELYQASQAKLTWTRGHVGAEFNELADEWANRARESKVTQPVKV